jgi:hypothetical protein
MLPFRNLCVVHRINPPVIFPLLIRPQTLEAEGVGHFFHQSMGLTNSWIAIIHALTFIDLLSTLYAGHDSKDEKHIIVCLQRTSI